MTSSPPCWWTVNKRSLIRSFCLSTSICSFHHCYLCLPRLHENHLSVLSKVLSLDILSCPQIWNIEQEKDREKEKVGSRPAKLNEKKSDRDLEREIKNRRRHFFVGRTT